MAKGLVAVGLYFVMTFQTNSLPTAPPVASDGVTFRYVSPIRFIPEARDPFELNPVFEHVAHEDAAKHEELEEMEILEEIEILIANQAKTEDMVFVFGGVEPIR